MTAARLTSWIAPVLGTLAFGVTPSAATVKGAEAPTRWWGVVSGAQPTNFSAPRKDEVFTLTVKGDKGDFLLVRRFEEQFHVKVLAFNATASEVETAAEELYPAIKENSFRSRRVVVAEKLNPPENTRVYEIRFPGQELSAGLPGEPPSELPQVFPDTEGLAVTFGGEPLELGKGPGEATGVETAKGETTDNTIVITAQNRGYAETNGKITIADTLPPGLQAVQLEGNTGQPSANRGPVVCDVTELICKLAPSVKLHPYEQVEVRAHVIVEPGAHDGEQNTAAVSGGGGTAVSATSTLHLGEKEAFGFEDYELIPEEAGGVVATQAGSHPFQLTSVVTLNTQLPEPITPLNPNHAPRTVGQPKTIAGVLPPGLIGNPTPFAQCTDAQFNTELEIEGHPANECPAASAVGVASVTFNEPQALHYRTTKVPIFNMTPRPGEPARFGLSVEGFASAFLDASLRTGTDYGVTVTSENISQEAWVTAVKLTFWGVPGDPRHDGQRGWACLEEAGLCSPPGTLSPPPFLAMPTSCEAPFATTLTGESWSSPGHPAEHAVASYTPPGTIDGCNRLQFNPSIKVVPDTAASSSAVGLNVDVHVPQQSILNAELPAQATIRNISVALPVGLAINPSGGDGLQACSEGLVGFTGFRELPAGGRTVTFTPKLPEPLLPGVNFCPDASKVGSVDISTPLLPPGQHLKGSVYVATQNSNPFGSLLAMYVVAEDPVSGSLVKLAGEVHLSADGQIVTTFKNSPPVPFEDAELHFYGGERAPLATPSRCGTYTTAASFKSWSADAGAPETPASSSFSITSGPKGAPCPGASLPFSPTLSAGSTNAQAGAFSPFTTTITRNDGDQSLGTVQVHTPAGLSGVLTGIKLCPERLANEGMCGTESLIGETTVSAGVGGDPVTVPGGKVYLTEKYEGAPFGLSIASPVKAGPFDLEHTPENHPLCDCIVVRAKIEVDPLTAALTVTSDSAGPFAIPTIIEGIPVDIRRVNVTINRPSFTFNPTNCGALTISGRVGSFEGAVAELSAPFQVTNCATKGFAPKFSVTTSGKTSRADGTSLSVRLEYPKAPFGSQTNISKVKITLPRQLPSRLTTLHQACLAAVFDANPARCPAASRVGTAKATTPVLPVPLTGPAYFVSHGGESFPSLIIVLQGYGVTVDLVGSTFISKGITTSTFKTVPDVPVSTFELSLPAGPFSALGAFGELCKSKLLMPTEFVAQNGAEIHQSTRIAVTGCPKAVKHGARKRRRAPKHASRHK